MATVPAAVLNAFTVAHGVHGETAEYLIDGEVVLPSLDVIPGTSQAEAIGNDSLVTTIDLQDFKVRAGDLVMPDEQKFVPARGHVIRVIRGDQVVDFTVNHPNLNEAPYRRSDAYGAVLRVHTLQVVPAEPAPADGE